MSFALRNANAPIQQLRDDEELACSIPWQRFVLSASLASPIATEVLNGRFLLRAIR
jgi:hypothetical protein